MGEESDSSELTLECNEKRGILEESTNGRDLGSKPGGVGGGIQSVLLSEENWNLI